MRRARNSIFYNEAQNLCSCCEYNGNYENDGNNTGLIKMLPEMFLRNHCAIIVSIRRNLRKNVT